LREASTSSCGDSSKDGIGSLFWAPEKPLTTKDTKEHKGETGEELGIAPSLRFLQKVDSVSRERPLQNYVSPPTGL
jgi:hypothetical protein